MTYRTANEQPEGAATGKRLPIDRTRRCFYCSGEATEWQRLVSDDAGHPDRLTHEWRPCTDALNEDGDVMVGKDGMPVCGHDECSEDWHCPPPPSGFGACDRCGRGRPIAHLVAAQKEVLIAGDPTWVSETEGRFPRPLFLCSDGCQEARRESRAFKQVTARVIERDEQDQGVADQALADAVPDDGEGLRVPDLEDLWGVSTRTARLIIARLLDKELIVAEDLPHRGGGKAPKAYWRAPS